MISEDGKHRRAWLAQPSVIWAALAVTALIDLYEMLYTVPLLKSQSGKLRIFDMRPRGYEVADAMRLLDALGEKGRACYATWHLPADMVLASVEGLGLLLAGLWLARQGRGIPDALLPAVRGLLVVMPLVTMSLDLFENVCVAAMLAEWPQLSPAVVQAASFATTAKWPASMLSLTALAAAALWYGLRRCRAD